jgi:hypothetical protein
MICNSDDLREACCDCFRMIDREYEQQLALLDETPDKTDVAIQGP